MLLGYLWACTVPNMPKTIAIHKDHFMPEVWHIPEKQKCATSLKEMADVFYAGRKCFNHSLSRMVTVLMKSGLILGSGFWGSIF